MDASLDIRLHQVKHGNLKAVTDLLKSGARDDVQNREGEYPAHVYAKRKDFHCLIALLLYGNPKFIDIANKDGLTPLHIAVEGRDHDCVSLLLAMGANVNAIDGRRHQTSLDIALNNYDEQLVRLLVGVGGKQFGAIQKEDDSDGAVPAPIRGHWDGRAERLDMLMERMRQEQPLDSITGDVITALQNLRAVPKKHHRILCLDGGGMKGLIQIEVLMQIEKSTGKRITELFDWIVGTSTGGIVALGLVYAKLSLFELRKLYFELCDEVFTTSGFGADSAKMDVLLKRTFKEARMCDVLEPRVLVTAVNAENTDLTLVYFNNCFGDNYSEDLVWRVARCTSAAPGYFEPLDKYIDGGVRANNPSNYALTKIQDSLAEQAKVYEQARGTGYHPVPTTTIGCLLSVGCGIYPPEVLSDFNPSLHLFVGKRLNSPFRFKRQLEELIKLLATAHPVPTTTIGCLLSVGCGIYPPEVLSDFNPSLHLFVGKRLNSPFRFKRQLEELIKLLATAVTYSEGEADNCRSRCERQGIKYYRLCPHLPEIVPCNETDKKKLCRMILEAKMLLDACERPFKQLIRSFD